MTDAILAIVFLSVSVFSTIAQTTSLVRLTRWRYDGSDRHRAVHRGLIRTAVCRVAAAVVYIGYGLVALFTPAISGVVSLIVFASVQALWIGNSLLDNRLKKRLGDDGTAQVR